MRKNTCTLKDKRSSTNELFSRWGSWINSKSGMRVSGQMMILFPIRCYTSFSLLINTSFSYYNTNFACSPVFCLGDLNKIVLHDHAADTIFISFQRIKDRKNNFKDFLEFFFHKLLPGNISLHNNNSSES
jgi:hypothetical protein